MSRTLQSRARELLSRDAARLLFVHDDPERGGDVDVKIDDQCRLVISDCYGTVTFGTFDSLKISEEIRRVFERKTAGIMTENKESEA